MMVEGQCASWDRNKVVIHPLKGFTLSSPMMVGGGEVMGGSVGARSFLQSAERHYFAFLMSRPPDLCGNTDL